MAQRVKAFATNSTFQFWTPGAHIGNKNGVVVDVCNPSTPTVRQEAETRESPGVLSPAAEVLEYSVQTLS